MNKIFEIWNRVPVAPRRVALGLVAVAFLGFIGLRIWLVVTGQVEMPETFREFCGF